MLILTRRIGEAVNIGDLVQVIITRVKGNIVSIGINAPLDIPIHREEVYLRIKKEYAAAQGRQCDELSR